MEFQQGIVYGIDIHPFRNGYTADLSAVQLGKTISIAKLLDDGVSAQDFDRQQQSFGNLPADFFRPDHQSFSMKISAGQTADFLRESFIKQTANREKHHVLLTAHVNLCYSHSGGDYLYHCSTAVEFTERILRTYTGGKYRRLEQHRAVLVPDVEE